MYKNVRNILLSVGVIILVSIGLVSCKQQHAQNEIRIATIAGPETTLVEVAKEVAQKQYGLTIKIVQFSDYVMPNTALSDGSVDANMFQHRPYLEQAIKAHGYRLTAIGKTFVYPMGVYSRQYSSLAQIPNGSVIAIPNDPSNEARALLLLQKAGLITLHPGVSVSATPLDVDENPHQLVFKELDAAQLPRVLTDVAAAVINTNYAIPAGLIPTQDAIFLEDKDSPYANLVVVRTEDIANPELNTKFQHLLAALHSTSVLDKAKELFKNQAIPAWGA
ncbi:MAG: MetQ/NlpA family ABC transporter substrate-binding protein [Gammaproteobacteria bacterium]